MPMSESHMREKSGNDSGLDNPGAVVDAPNIGLHIAFFSRKSIILSEDIGPK